jgi:hypothetical protein
VWLLVVSLVVPTLAVVFAATYLTVRTIAFFRQVGATGKVLGPELERVAAVADQVAVKAEGMSKGATQMESALERLRTSQAELSVLLAAARDVRESVGGVTALVPRK